MILLKNSIINVKFKSISYPAGIYLLIGNNRNTRSRCEICSKLTIMTFCFPIANFEHVIPGRVIMSELKLKGSCKIILQFIQI